MTPFNYNEAFSRNLGVVSTAEHERLRNATVAIAGMGLAPLWVSDMIRGSVSEIITHLMN